MPISRTGLSVWQPRAIDDSYRHVLAETVEHFRIVRVVGKVAHHCGRNGQERGFGPALRRLRIQRGLSREGFPGVSAKFIARLERGEVARPHGRTLNLIASALGVPADQIESY